MRPGQCRLKRRSKVKSSTAVQIAKKGSACISAALAVLLLCGPAARANIMTTVAADADSWIGDGAAASPIGNHGGDTQLAVHRSNGVAKSYLHFNLSGLDAGLAVTEARLKLDLEVGQYNASDVKLFAIMDEAKDWNLTALPENVIDETNAPQANLGNEPFLEEGNLVDSVTREIGLVTDIPGDWLSQPEAINIDVTALIQWALGQNPAYSTFADTDDCVTIPFRIDRDYCFPKFASKENTSWLPPRLEVTQVPEPASAALLILALAALAARRRHSR